MITEQFAELDLSDVVPSDENDRPIDPSSPDMKELTLSISAIGLLEPIIVRPHPTLPGKYDLRAGGRRFIACGQAGLTKIPAVIMDLDDQRALEVTVVENHQREGLPVHAEAKAVSRLLGSGKNQKQAAKAMGKSLSWLHSRAKIDSLIPKWKKAIEGKDKKAEKLTQWGVGHLEAVAKLGPDAQADLFERYHDAWEVPDTERLERVIGNLTHSLSTVPFDKNKANIFPGAIACTDCPHRSGASPLLFGYESSVPDDKETCQESNCYNQKLDHYAVELLRIEQAKDPKTLAVVQKHSYSSYSESFLDQDTKKKEFVKCSEKSKDGTTAIVMSGDLRGTKIVCKEVVHVKYGSVKTVGNVKFDIEKKRESFVKAKMKESIEGIKLDTMDDLRKINLGTPFAILELLTVFGLSTWNWGMDIFPRFIPDRFKAVRDMGKTQDEMLPKLAQVVIKDISSSQNRSMDEYPIIAHYFGVDFKALEVEAQERYPHPVEWAGLKDSDPAPKIKPKGKKK